MQTRLFEGTSVRPDDVKHRLLCGRTFLQVMVANIRCAEIMEDQLRALGEDQAWLGLRQEAASGLVPDFGTRAAALLDSCLSGTPSDQPPLLHGQLVLEITLNKPCFVIAL